MSDGLTQTAAAISAVIAIVGGLGYAFRKWVRPAYKQVKRVTEAADRLLPFAEEQLRPNGGSSLADKINKIASNHTMAEAHWKRLEEGQSGLAEIVEAHHQEVSQRLGAIEGRQT